MNFTEKELKTEYKAAIYDLGYAVLGDNAGGIVTTLMQRLTIRGAHKALRAARKAADPKAYIGGVLRQEAQKLNDAAKIGDRMGNFEYDGSKWKEVE